MLQMQHNRAIFSSQYSIILQLAFLSYYGILWYCWHVLRQHARADENMHGITNEQNLKCKGNTDRVNASFTLCCRFAAEWRLL